MLGLLDSILLHASADRLYGAVGDHHSVERRSLSALAAGVAAVVALMPEFPEVPEMPATLVR